MRIRYFNDGYNKFYFSTLVLKLKGLSISYISADEFIVYDVSLFYNNI